MVFAPCWCGSTARPGVNRLDVAVNLAVGLVVRSGPLWRRRADNEWVASTVDQPRDATLDRLAGVAPPGGVLVDGDTFT